ncbi:unnamed protein product [Periconia digitata]|uniref:L domain-like protein n=1 Tax=Periconia digitata TaxID=1303443 RepID=A0A9W4UQS2_9PLEO|nr:unnamed protein product [Periconia digitata]
MDQRSSGIPVRSGIPRPASKIPALRASASQSHLHSASQSASAPDAQDPLLRKKSSLSSISRRSSQQQLPPPSLQKKASRSSIAIPPSAGPAANKPSNRTSLYSAPISKRPVPVKEQARSSIPNSRAPTFKKPTVPPPFRQTPAVPQPTRLSNQPHDEDVLGDLNGFRSASRASSRASSCAGLQEAESADFLEESDGEIHSTAQPPARKSRPSLSDRTIESLSQLPSSPSVAKGRRRSSFFNADQSMPPPVRPTSALSNGIRPTTSDGAPQPDLITPRKSGPSTTRLSMTAPGKRSSSATMATNIKTPSLSRLNSTMKKQPLSHMHNLQDTPKARPLSNSKTMLSRTPKPRASIAGVFGEAVSPPTKVAATTPSPSQRASVAKKTPITSKKAPSSSLALREHIAKAKATRKPDVLPSPEDAPPKANSSQTLREQIAKAKATAKRNNTTHEPRTSTPPRDAIVPNPAEIAGFDFGLEDPFNQGPKNSKSLLRKRIDAARVEGKLNLAAMGMNEMPEDVMQMYKYDSNDTGVVWSEVVDVTIIIAADNEFQTLPDRMFPDIDIESMTEADEDTAPQFGALQNLDLHGNVLQELPMGLRQLTQLSKLNLSRNKLTLDALNTVCQISSLRELKLAENEFNGSLPSCIGDLAQLEALELQANKLTSLPPEIRALVHLRTLNISGNKITSLPMELFEHVPIIELIASNNAFTGAFFEIDSMPQLQNLQLANNSITGICQSTTVTLPDLKYLDLSGNRLSALPDVSSWTSLVTLLIGENNVATLPDSLFSLQMLRNIDLTANNISRLDERIALMEGLENITLAANPLRERKFLTMATEDIKRDLMSKIQPENADQLAGVVGTTEENPSDSVNGWKLTPSGTFDLSFQNLLQLDDEAIASFAQENSIRQLYLASNYLSSLPVITAQLSALSVLDLSKNNISIPLSEPLELSKLRELKLHGNKLHSLDAVTSLLSAPKLQHLDVSNNRIAGSLPLLRESFPELLFFLAADNVITEVSAESLHGLKCVDVSNNDIGRLEPMIGQLSGTLTSLNVEGNRFRVPNYAVLKKGTDAILAWLRDKIPSPTEDFFSPSAPGSSSSGY